MTERVAQAIVNRAFALGPDAEVTFAFQGGEPTCAGLSFFERFVAYAHARRERQTVHWAIQTNGYAIDQAWIDFLATHHFLVGVSLDGYRSMHDHLRPDAGGKGTHRRVMDAIRGLRAAGVDVNVLTVLTDQLARHPQQLHRFYQQERLDFIQLIPCLPGLDGAADPYALTPHRFASFYKVFFRLWAQELAQGTYRSVTLFDNVIPMFRGVLPSQCGMLGRCAVQFVVEGSGDVYPCDFYVLDRYRLGNIETHSLEAMATCDVARDFLSEPRRPCSACDDCPFMGICHKNCKRLNVAYYTDDYCGYRDFLEEAAPTMRAIARAL